MPSFSELSRIKHVDDLFFKDHVNKMESTQSNIFHIHIDATNMSPELDEFALGELGFIDSDFNGHPAGYVHFEPKRHLTLKLETKQAFAEAWDKLEKKANECANFIGYLEGEFIPKDEFIPYKPYQDKQLPFKISRRTLQGSKEELFRQTEFHLTFEKNRTDPVLIKRLLDGGLYGAYLQKQDGEFLVLTAQGYIKEITPLYEKLKEYLLTVGGAYRCTLKEERAIKFKMYGIEPSNLPEIVNEFEFIEI